MQNRPGDDSDRISPNAQRDVAPRPTLDGMERRAQTNLAIRFGVYAGLMAVLLVSLPATFGVRHDGSITEGTILEQLQLVALSATVLLFLVCAWRRADARGPLIAFAGAAALAIVRELDFWFDTWIPWGGWVLPAIGAGTVAAVCAWHCRASFPTGVPRLLRSPGFPLMWCGAVTVLMVAQLIGHGPTMEEIMGTGFRRLGKRFVEEALEMVGYLILLFGAIEVAMTMWWDRNAANEQ